MPRYSLLASLLLAASLIYSNGCRSCSSCHDYDSPVANCHCGHCPGGCGCHGGSTCGCEGGGSACGRNGGSACGCNGGGGYSTGEVGGVPIEGEVVTPTNPWPQSCSQTQEMDVSR